LRAIAWPELHPEHPDSIRAPAELTMLAQCLGANFAAKGKMRLDEAGVNLQTLIFLQVAPILLFFINSTCLFITSVLISFPTTIRNYKPYFGFRYEKPNPGKAN
jgi:hypothetical protein